MKYYLLSVFILLGLIGCAESSSERQLRIAVAANFQVPMQALVDEYKKTHPKVDISLSSASSGVLFAQVKRGAPFDLFFSADSERPLQLGKELEMEKVYTYAYGRLVLWSPKFNELRLENLTRVTGKIAIAKPELAPYGAATQYLLRQTDIWPQIEPKIVWGNNVAQVEQFLKSGAVDAGFLSLAQVRSSNIDENAIWIVPSKLYNPIEQKVILLEQGDNTEQGQSFVNFVLSDRGQEVISQLGYAKANSDDIRS
ncbi:molybdate ABC transporter substrate-binding protein [Alteromonadaceae bacterium M269]|nr:molybdate ABC transporter substrate-binding protein [Alteromonadaceae bacterium M269]